MRITRRDIKVVLLLIGILSAFVVYQFYFKNQLDEIETKNNEITQLEKDIEELEKKSIYKEKYRKDMGDMDNQVIAKVNEFPADQWYEDGIMFLDYMERRHQLEKYKEEKMKIYFHTYEFTEATTVDTLLGELNTKMRLIELRDATTKAEFYCDYSALKEMVKAIYANKDTRRMIREMNIEVKWNGTFPLEGDIQFSSFAMYDPDHGKDPREYKRVEIPGYEEVYKKTIVEGVDYVPATVVNTDTGETEYDDIIGIDCVFGDLTPTTEAETSTESLFR